MYKLKQLLNEYCKLAEPDVQLIRDIEALLEDEEIEGFNQRAHRHAVREDWLDKHVPDRQCGICKEIKTRSKAWVRLNHSQKLLVNQHPELTLVGWAVCKSCYMVFNNRVSVFRVEHIQQAKEKQTRKKRLERLCDECS